MRTPPLPQSAMPGRRGQEISRWPLHLDSPGGAEIPEDMGCASKTALCPALGQAISRGVPGRVFTILPRSGVKGA